MFSLIRNDVFLSSRLNCSFHKNTEIPFNSGLFFCSLHFSLSFSMHLSFSGSSFFLKLSASSSSSVDYKHYAFHHLLHLHLKLFIFFLLLFGLELRVKLGIQNNFEGDQLEVNQGKYPSINSHFMYVIIIEFKLIHVYFLFFQLKFVILMVFIGMTVSIEL